jgi:hypothetical protein
LQCHSALAFAPHGFDSEHHAAAGFALEGAHSQVECAVCHVESAPGTARTFRGTQSSCKDCHADAHDGRPGLQRMSLHERIRRCPRPGV